MSPPAPSPHGHLVSQFSPLPAGEQQVNRTKVVGRAALVEETGQRHGQTPGVLVVDDEPLIQALLRAWLQRQGFEVWLASNGSEAIDLYRLHREAIAVVLLDVRMPGLDGPQTLDALRRLNPEVVACFMSGDTGCHQPAGLLERGARHLFAKPFHLDNLARTLWQLAHDVSKA
jgi:CheY-like chemotaxis protein